MLRLRLQGDQALGSIRLNSKGGVGGNENVHSNTLDPCQRSGSGRGRNDHDVESTGTVPDWYPSGAGATEHPIEKRKTK